MPGFGLHAEDQAPNILGCTHPTVRPPSKPFLDEDVLHIARTEHLGLGSRVRTAYELLALRALFRTRS